MTSPSTDGAPASLVSPTSRLLISLLPDPYRDDIAGDLIEEASTVIMPRSGIAAARRWIALELLRSMPRMMLIHFKQEDDGMKHAKWLAAALILTFGVVQAWDSGILAAPPLIVAMVAIAIAAGLTGVFVAHEGIRFALAIAVLVILSAARLLSPAPLPELGLIALPVFVVLILGPRFLALAKEKQKQGPPGPGAPAV